jgi:hypothetical protein
VITDHAYKLAGAMKILWGNKPPKAFDAFVGQLMNDIRAHESGVIPFPELSPTAYNGYQAILTKVRVVSSVSSLLSELSLPLACLPFQGRSVPRSSGESFSADSSTLLSTSHVHQKGLPSTSISRQSWISA